MIQRFDPIQLLMSSLISFSRACYRDALLYSVRISVRWVDFPVFFFLLAFFQLIRLFSFISHRSFQFASRHLISQGSPKLFKSQLCFCDDVLKRKREKKTTNKLKSKPLHWQQHTIWCEWVRVRMLLWSAQHHTPAFM